jgi:iron(III) transport system substrate-binding protein
MYRSDLGAKVTALILIAVFLSAGTLSSAHADDGLNVYSYRQEFLIRPFLDAFSKQTGIPVRVIFAKKGMLQRLKAEGKNSPADVILTVDIARLSALHKAGLTRTVNSNAINQAIPPQYRDAQGNWFGLSIRARILLASKARVRPGAITRYEDLAKPEWKGRICMRSGRHPYNRALVASMIANLGPEKAKVWAQGLHANLVRKPQGNDRAQAKAIFQGLCDIGIANQYYFGKMKFNKKKPKQQQWAEAVYLIFPNAEDRGTHVNISGMAMAKHSKNPAAAKKIDGISDQRPGPDNVRQYQL